MKTNKTKFKKVTLLLLVFIAFIATTSVFAKENPKKTSNKEKHFIVKAPTIRPLPYLHFKKPMTFNPPTYLSTSPLTPAPHIGPGVQPNDGIWQINNETDCDVDVNVWFIVTLDDNGEVHTDHLSYHIGAGGTAIVDRYDIFMLFGGVHGLTINDMAMQVHASADEGSSYTDIYPSGDCTIHTSAKAPCDCLTWHTDIANGFLDILPFTGSRPCTGDCPH